MYTPPAGETPRDRLDKHGTGEVTEYDPDTKKFGPEKDHTPDTGLDEKHRGWNPTGARGKQFSWEKDGKTVYTDKYEAPGGASSEEDNKDETNDD